MQVLTLRVSTVILFKFIHKRPGQSHLLLHIMMNFQRFDKKIVWINNCLKRIEIFEEFVDAAIILGISSQDGLKMVLKSLMSYYGLDRSLAFG